MGLERPEDGQGAPLDQPAAHERGGGLQPLAALGGVEPVLLAPLVAEACEIDETKFQVKRIAELKTKSQEK